MAVINPLHYTYKNSLVHSHNAIFKLFELVIIAAAAALSSVAGSFALLLFICTLVFAAQISLKQLAGMTLRFIPLLALIGVASYFSSENSEGNPAEVMHVIVKFMVYILSGSLFAYSTSPRELGEAVFILLKPLSLNAARHTAGFFRIILSLVPIVFGTYENVNSAVLSRSISSSKNPLRKIKHISYGLMVNSFLHSVQFSDALESRAYSGHYSKGDFSVGCGDCLIFFSVLFVAVFLSKIDIFLKDILTLL